MNSSLLRYAHSRLPTSHGVFELYVYRVGAPRGPGQLAVGGGNDNLQEHMAMVMGEVGSGAPVLARVHSSCFTGEVLHSLRCDCRAQLDQALARIAAEGRGVVVYLVQEGRGIGLGDKIRAYALQDQGKDTVEANLELGFDADGRDYQLAAAILRDLEVGAVRLMTNNPAKIEGLRQAGIEVASHQAHWVEASAESQAYLEAKQQKMGHIK